MAGHLESRHTQPRVSVRCLIGIVLLLVMSSLVQAQTSQTIHRFDIPAGPLIQALDRFGEQSGLQVSYDAALLHGKTAAPLQGSLNTTTALKRLLHSSGLQFKFLGSSTVVISKAPAATAPIPKRATRPAPSPTSTASAPPPTTLSTVTVTGSHIRGAPPTSPVIDISQEQMIQAGQTDLGEVIRSIPQNFSGGQNPGVGLGASLGGGISNQNLTGGSAANLRGLGADATLTLLNGRRLSFNGFVQAVDISQIPLAAVERIEVVADGASAIYGSDAVAGVINVILKPDYDGFSATARLGGATSGGDFEQQYSVVGGTKWATGGFIATASYEKTTSLDANQRDYTNHLDAPYTLFPARKVRSAVFSAHQRLSAFTEFKIDALYNKRSSGGANNSGSVIAGIHRFVNEYAISPTLAFQLPKSWSLSINGTYARDKSVLDQWAHLPDGTMLAGSKACACNIVEGWEIDSDGSLFQLPGGDAKIALGIGYRKNSYDHYSLRGPFGRRHDQVQQHSYYAFGELYLPVVSPDLGVTGIHELSFNAALRREQYNTFGGVTTPKVGVIYAPTADINLKASWGKSFKTPTLTQQFDPFFTYLWNAATVGGVGYPGSATALMTYGGNPDLEPERAKTWTMTLGLHPGALPGFRTELSYFHIDYNQRVIQGISNRMAALSNPAYQPFVTMSPTSKQIQQAVESAGLNFFNYANVPYDPGSVIAIINNRYVNIASWKIHGLDLLANYEFDWGDNTLRLSGNVSWLKSEQQTTPLAPTVDLSGTIFNPPNWHARFGATWVRGPLVLSAYYSYIGAVTDVISWPNVNGDPMQTIDLTGIYHFANDLDLSVSARNLTNERPPYLKPVRPDTVNFDSTNYSPIGRYVGVTLTKRWH